VSINDDSFKAFQVIDLILVWIPQESCDSNLYRIDVEDKFFNQDSPYKKIQFPKFSIKFVLIYMKNELKLFITC